MKTIYLSKDIINISTVVKKDEYRAELRGIFFEKSGIATGTDGHTLISISDERLKALDADVIIPADIFKEIKKTEEAFLIPEKNLIGIKKFDRNETVNTFLDGVDEKYFDRLLNYTPIDGKYPPYRDVLPSEPIVYSVGLGISGLESLYNYVKKTGAIGISLECQQNNRGAIKVQFQSMPTRPEHEALVMPIIID